MWKLTLGYSNSSFHELEINSEFGKPFCLDTFSIVQGAHDQTPPNWLAACEIHEEISSTSTTSHFNLSFEVCPCLLALATKARILCFDSL
jgi:hypothetical protein